MAPKFILHIKYRSMSICDMFATTYGATVQLASSVYVDMNMYILYYRYERHKIKIKSDYCDLKSLI